MSERVRAQCRICANAQGNRLHQVRETMYGTPGAFRYLECGACGCLQLQDIPPDMAPWYPADYCSYGRAAARRVPAWRRRLKALRTAMLLGAFGRGGRWLVRVMAAPPYADWMARLSLGLDARILDVGCGAGHLLLRLHKDGFRSLVGLDPYIAETLAYPGGPLVKKQRIEDLEGEFDLIMLHHAFEHMDRPREVLASLVRHLAPDGRLLIRIPLAGSYAWRKYGASWANLDAPRHLFLHTPGSLALVAAAAGMAVESIVYDSQYKQIALSEWLSLGGTMRAYDQWERNSYTKNDIRGFRRAARTLNARCDGDAAAFVLVRTTAC